MHQRIRNIDGLKSYCEKFISEQASVLAKMDEARANGTIRHFLNYNGASLHQLTVYADEAGHILEFINGEREENDNVMSDERKFEILRENSQRRLLNLNMRITSRSTSMSANLDEDSERAFWIELYQVLNGGY